MARNNRSNSSMVVHQVHSTTENLDPHQNHNSSYYLHPSEGPSTVTITPSLTHNNYHVWARSVRRAFIGKNKLEFVDGSLPMPDDFDPAQRSWLRWNTLVLSWIINFVSPSIAKTLIFKDTAQEGWIELRDQFSQGDMIRVSKLQQEIHSFQQGTLSVNDYFTELKVLWEELDNYRPIPNCNCASAQYRKQDDIIRFLTGLNDQFEVVRSHILLMDPLPNLNRVVSMVLQQERQSSGGTLPAESQEQVFSNAAYNKQQYKGKGNSKTCTFCGKIGHTVENKKK